MLRLVCTEMHSLCWDYFCNVCVNLSVWVSSECSPHDDSMLGLGAGIMILKGCKKIQGVEIVSSRLGGGSHAGVEKLLSTLIDAGGVLKRLRFSRVDLSSAIPLLERLSFKCRELKELELCGVAIGTLPVQWVLALMLQHSKQTLLKLSIKDLVFSPSQPLPVEALSSLQHLSVSPSNVGRVIKN